MPKPKEKAKISAGARVLLKNDKSTDGKVLGSAGKAKWSVEWTEGDQRGKTAEQSTKSIAFGGLISPRLTSVTTAATAARTRWSQQTTPS